MNLDEKTPNGVESNDPANNAASLAQVTLKSPKPGNGGAKQRRPKNASDAMGGAGAKDKPAKSKSRKKALNFDDLAQATASIEAAAAARANVVSISEVRTPAETPAAPDVAPAADAAAAAPVVEVPAEATDLIPAPAAEFTPEAEGDSMDAALDLPQTQLLPEAEETPVAQMEAEPVASEPEPVAPVAKPAPAAQVEPAPAFLAPNGHGAEAPAIEPEPKLAAEENAGGRSRFEAIAARAARAQGTRSQPGSAVQAALAAQQQAAERTRQGNDFYSFWAQRKNGRRFPSYGDFDAKQIAELWPNTMLLSCGILGSGNVNFTQVMRLTGTPATAEGADEVNFTPMLTEWMLAIGREAAKAGKPVQDIETFQNPGGASSYRIVALPLGNEETQVDHVLCNLARA